MAKTKAQKEISGVLRKELAPLMQELTLAYERINGNSVKRLRWLLSFSEVDLTTVSSGNLVNIGWEVSMFALNVKPDKIPDDFNKYVDLQSLMHPWGPEIPRMLEQLQKTPRQPPKLNKVSPSLILHFQQKMKTIFDTLYSGEWWEYIHPQVKKRIALQHIRDSKGGIKADNWEQMQSDQLLELRAFELIQAEKGRLMICANPKCNRRFVATKKGRSLFHSPTCSAYVRIAKSRGKKI